MDTSIHAIILVIICTIHCFWRIVVCLLKEWFDFSNCTGRDFVASFVSDGSFEKGSLGNNVVHETVLGHTYASSANASYEKIKLQNMPKYNVILKKIDEHMKIGDRTIKNGLYLVKKSA